MAMRITTGGTLHMYKSNLMRSNKSLNDARNKVLTQRNFNSYAEDPAAATQSFQLRRSFWRTASQITNNTAVINTYDTAWNAVEDVVDDLGNQLASVSALRGVSDATASGRKPLGEVLRSAARSVVQTMNVRYGDNFVFAGADGMNVPFSWDADGALLYRGVNVDSGDADTLKAMTEETTYVDLGMGLSEDSSGKLVTSSAFNSSLSGLHFLGYGVDSDGDPKNIVSIMKELGDIFSNCDADTGAFASSADQERANRLSDKLKNSLSTLTAKHTEMDTTATFLNTNLERLESTADTLNEQILSIEKMDPADAITAMSWAQYCYNAALKVGNSILSQSLLDYMN